MTKLKISGSLLLLIVLACAVSIGVDMRRHRQVHVVASPPRGLDVAIYRDLHDAYHGRTVDWSNLNDTLTYLDDFWMAPLLRVIYRHANVVDAANWDKIRQAVFQFRYWMDQPGEDSRCYWSENHQILYASAEFLAGQKFPDAIFTRDGRTGREHREEGRKRVLTWLEQRWNHGFAEWYSNVYYVEDVAPLCNLIDFSEDEEIVTKSRIVLDLLLYDVATQSLRGCFVSTMGRAYGKNRMSGEGGNSMRGIIQAIWGFDLPVPDGKRMDGCFLFRERYQVPEVIKAIGRHEGPALILASQGLDLAELREEQAGSEQDARIMLQWGMEAFSNPEVIEDTMNYVDRHRMFSNAFLKDLTSVDFTLLRRTSALPLVSRWLDPVSNGTPLQRANTYTYRTPHFLLASVQHYHPGELNDQHHVWSATLSNRLSVFTAHPPWVRPNRVPPAEDPGYWVGPGRLPDAAQHENICLLIYRVPERPTMGEKGVSGFTHAYFPRESFDRVELRGKRAYGQHGDTFVALIGRFPLNYRTGSTSDLVQEGFETTWVCEVSDRSRDGDFDAFVRRMDSNDCAYDEGQLTYQSGGRRLVLPYGKLLRVDEQEQPGQYPRHKSPYATTRRKAENMTLEYGGHRLFLDFAKQLRREG